MDFWLLHWPTEMNYELSDLSCMDTTNSLNRSRCKGSDRRWGTRKSSNSVKALPSLTYGKNKILYLLLKNSHHFFFLFFTWTAITIDCNNRNTSSDKYWLPTIPPGVGLGDPRSLLRESDSLTRGLELSHAYFSKMLVKLGLTFWGVGWIKSSKKTRKISHL